MEILFLLFAALAVVSAFSVILQRNPIYSAISLIVTLCALAAVFLTLSAQFIAAIQVVVYAGAIMVLFVFVIMLLNVRTEEAKPDQQKYLKWLAVPLLIALLSEVLIVVKVMNIPPPDLPQTGDPSQIIGTTESIGHGMFSSYLLPFEAASVLILMAIVGAMLLARREPMPKLESAGEAAQQAPSQPSESQTIQEEVVAAGHH